MGKGLRLSVVRRVRLLHENINELSSSIEPFCGRQEPYDEEKI